MPRVPGGGALNVPTYDAPTVQLTSNPGVVPDRYTDITRDMPVPRFDTSRLTGVLGKIQDDMDEARAMDVEVRMRKHVIDTTYGENGYRNLKGEDALAPDENGKSLYDRQLDGFDREFARVTEEMKLTPNQVEKARKRLYALRMSDYQNASSYWLNESINYQTNSCDTLVAQAQQEGALDASLFSGSVETINDALAQKKSLLGWSDEMFGVAKRKAMSELVSGRIGVIMSNAETNPAVAYQARSLLNTYADQMEAKDVYLANARIDATLQNYHIARMADSFQTSTEGQFEPFDAAAFQAVAGTSEGGRVMNDVAFQLFGDGRQLNDDGTTRYQEREGGVYGVGMSGVREDMALRSAQRRGQDFDVTAFNKDRGYNFRLGVQAFEDCMIESKGDLVEALARFNAGDDVVVKAKAQAEKEGNAGAWLGKLPEKTQQFVVENVNKYQASQQRPVTNAKGERVSFFDARYGTLKKSWATYADAEKYVDRMMPQLKNNPAVRQRAINTVMQRVVQDKATFTEEQRQLAAEISDILVRNNGDVSKIPAELLTRVPPTAMQDVLSKSRKIQRGDTTPNWSTYLYWKDNPEFLELPRETAITLAQSEFGKYADEMIGKWYANRTNTAAQEDKRAEERVDASQGRLRSGYVLKDTDFDRALGHTEYGRRIDRKSSPRDLALWSATKTAVELAIQAGTLNPDNPGAVEQWVNRALGDIAHKGGERLIDLDIDDLKGGNPAMPQELVRQLAKNDNVAAGWNDTEPTDDQVREKFFSIMVSPNFELNVDLQNPNMKVNLDPKVVEYLRTHNVNGEPRARAIEGVNQELIRDYIFYVQSGGRAHITEPTTRPYFDTAALFGEYD